MRATTLHDLKDIRFTEVPDPVIEAPTDAIVKITASCICGSDLWNYRGDNTITPGMTIGHECLGIVEEVGSSVTSFRPGDFVIVPFCHCDNTCPHCLAGVQSACTHVGFTMSGQAEYTRVTQAEGTLYKVPGDPGAELMPSLLSLTDVMATGWHAAVAAGVRKGGTAVVVGDGAVGLCGVIAASVMGAEKVIAMSRHADRQKLAMEFGATHIVATRGEEGEAEVLELTDGVGADAVLECVGTGQAMNTAFSVARPGAMVGFVGAPHGVTLPVRQMFVKNVGLAGGMAPVRRYLDELLPLVLDGRIDPGRVFDMTLPLESVADGYRAMDERTAIKVFLQP
ncbi:zinc-dependent alcohol dehydrogenase family protein [Nocardioides panacihumi]|uniref:Zinc-dependent alcohol dehydrogenase family protein n=1 Tax=Nocardioides panacihumi TaxID=400774 RepID=A0ABN2RS48_9ACTN